MKTEFNRLPVDDVKLTFPLLAVALPEVGDNTNLVVLFFDYKSGTVLNASHGWTVGEVHPNFAEVTDPRRWRILGPGESVVLTN